MPNYERCTCGDTECPSCGTAQGTYTEAMPDTPTNPVVAEVQKPLTERGWTKIDFQRVQKEGHEYPILKRDAKRMMAVADQPKLIAEIQRLESALASAREEGFNEARDKAANECEASARTAKELERLNAIKPVFADVVAKTLTSQAAQIRALTPSTPQPTKDEA